VNGKSTSILTSIKRFQPCSNNNISVGKLKVESWKLKGALVSL